jgi:DNA polymerase-3 subunit alpha/error-prone DNA polymerase
MAALLSATSYFTLMRGIHSPHNICRKASQLGYDTLALTDRNNLYGLPEFLKACRYFQIRPIIGAEITDGGKSIFAYTHEKKGFETLCQLITEKQCNDSFQIQEFIKNRSRGLFIASDDIEQIRTLSDILPVYYRICSLGRPPDYIRKNNIPCLIIPRSVFFSEEDYSIHVLLRAIDLNTSLNRVTSEELYKKDSHIVPWKAVCDRFGVFQDALYETERFSREVKSYTDFGTPVMPEYKSHSDEAPSDILRKKSFAGAIRRYGNITPKIRKRLEYELDMITQKGFSSYFLVVEEIVAQSPRTCGRGSGAASCVAYCLGITNVDPIRHNLFFERFLNPGRKDPPDIDIDFAWDERDSVLDYVFSKYGEKNAAMVANHLTFQPRMAMRETARVYGFTESEISSITKKFPYFYAMSNKGVDIQHILKNHPKTKDIPVDPPWMEIISMAQKLIGIPRGIGTHCGGVIVTHRPISIYAPVQRSAKGYPIIQWEKDGTEEMGLVKIDLLGNRSLAVIRDAILNLKREGINIDESKWDPVNDMPTISLLSRGQTMGVFYVESPAMRLLQKKTGYGDFDHLVIHSSIIRPAANKYINEYIRRLHGAGYQVEHPILAEVLSETYGIMVYQEDVSKVAMALSDFSSSEADALRKIMSKKDRYNTLNDFREKFFCGAQKKGVSVKAIENIWNMCLSFKGYSFCKPHSASYVQVSFQSAYLKTHYHAAFIAAVMSNYGGFYSTQAYVSEAQRSGITIYRPDVNRSEDKFEQKGSVIYVGLCQIKGLSEKARDIIIRERDQNGPFPDFYNFLQRTEIKEKDTEKLILAGACDNMDQTGNRSKLFWKMRCYYRRQKRAKTPELKTYSKIELLRSEYSILGFLTVYHPIQLVKKRKKNNTVKIKMLKEYINKHVTFWGWMVTAKTVLTKHGDAMQFVSFEDETDICETVFFPEVYNRFVRILIWKEAFLVYGRVTEEFGAVSVEVLSVEL